VPQSSESKMANSCISLPYVPGIGEKAKQNYVNITLMLALNQLDHLVTV
jgi:hypothetical protein